jgi:hypothetical protein
VRNELATLFCSLSKATGIAGSCRPRFCKTPVLYRKPPSSPDTEWETRRTRATAAQGVPIPFRGETVIICVTADSFTAVYYMRNWVWTVSTLNFHLTAFHCINIHFQAPMLWVYLLGQAFFHGNWILILLHLKQELKSRSEEQWTVAVCFDSFKLLQATLKISLYYMTSVGENSIYIHSGNRPSLDRIGTSTSGDMIGTGYVNAIVLSTWPKLLFWLDFKQYCTACIVKFGVNVTPHSTNWLSLEYKVLCTMKKEVQSNNSVGLCVTSFIASDILL